MSTELIKLKSDAQAAAAAGDFKKVVLIWDSVLDLPGLSHETRADALLFRCEAKELLKDREGAIADCGAVLALAGAADEQKAEALQQRARFKAKGGAFKDAVPDLTAVLELPGASADRRAQALLLRGELWCSLFKADQELADYDAVLAMPDVSPNRHAAALFGRAYARHTPDPAAAKRDYEKILAMAGVSDKWRGLARQYLAKLP